MGRLILVLGKRLLIETGFPGGRRPSNWTVQDYATQWKQYAAAIDEKLRPLSDSQECEPLFQGGAFEAPRHLNNLSYFTVQTAEESGIASTGKVKTMADHDVGVSSLFRLFES